MFNEWTFKYRYRENSLSRNTVLFIGMGNWKTIPKKFKYLAKDKLLENELSEPKVYKASL